MPEQGRTSKTHLALEDLFEFSPDAIFVTDADGAIRETFRTLKPRGGPKPLRAFSFLEVEEEEPLPKDQLDLLALARKEAP